jgi:hypothetical protein
MDIINSVKLLGQLSVHRHTGKVLSRMGDVVSDEIFQLRYLVGRYFPNFLAI